MLKRLIFKTVAIMFAFALFVVPAGAAEMEEEIEETSVVAVVEPITSLNLEQSIRLAVENSTAIAIAKIDHDQAMADLRQARRDARDIRDMRRDRVPGIFTYDVQLAERILPRIMEMVENVSYMNIEFTTNRLKVQVENAYYGVLWAEMELQNTRASLSRAKEQLRLIEVGVEAGVNAQVDVLSAELIVASQELLVAFAENSLRQTRMNFNNLVGLTLDDEVILTSSFEFIPQVFNLDEVKELAKERDILYFQLRENYEIQREALNLARGFFTPNVYAYQEAVRNYEIARLNIKNINQDMDLVIKRAYLNLQTAEERVGLMEKSVEQARENYRLISLRFEVGMATLFEIEWASGELDNAKAELLSAIYDYNISATMLRHGLF